MDEIQNLEIINLNQKITKELYNYTGIKDKVRRYPRHLSPSLIISCHLQVLAEFVIDIHTQSKDLKDFKSRLSEMGATFPDSALNTIDRLIVTMHPSYKQNK